MVVLILLVLLVNANDGVFYANGNQLIPIVETDISVKREVLNITRQGDYAIVDVYYEFFNPTKQKTLLVGFEAPSPYNAFFNFSDYHDQHPFISDFTVNMNGKDLPYRVALVVDDSLYYKGGNFIYADTQGMKNRLGTPLDAQYVYHFTAVFQPGLNTVHHQYKYRFSSHIGSTATLYYTLTAANRWANHQIDDFTLNIDMGQHTTFSIPITFFENISEWQFCGIGLCKKTPPISQVGVCENEYITFHIQHGYITLHKENFHPKGELSVQHFHYVWDLYEKGVKEFIKTFYLTGSLDEWFITFENYLKESNHTAFPDDAKRILRNLPWAYRGYIFKDKELQKFYESTQWYVANPAYKGSQDDFSMGDNKWVNYWDGITDWKIE